MERLEKARTKTIRFQKMSSPNRQVTEQLQWRGSILEKRGIMWKGRVSFKGFGLGGGVSLSNGVATRRK